MKLMSFIGTGVMGSSFARAACKGNNPNDIALTNLHAEKAKALCDETGAYFCKNNIEAAKQSKYILACIKPQVGEKVIKEISATVKECVKNGEEKILVSIMAGISIATLREWIDVDIPIIRTLPNVAADVGKCLTLCCVNDLVTDEMFNEFSDALKFTGKFEKLDEAKMTAGGVITGCAPAFVCMFIEALSDGGVMTGLTRAQAQEYAVQAIIGAATLVEESGKHPGKIKDEICSPGGSTIAGVISLEKSGFRNDAIQSVLDTYNRILEMGKNK